MLRSGLQPCCAHQGESEGIKKALAISSGLFLNYSAAVVSAATSVAVVSAGAGATVSVDTVSTVSEVSAGLDPQKVSAKAKTAHKAVAKVIFNDFFIFSGLKFPFIHEISEGHPYKKNIFIGLPYSQNCIKSTLLQRGALLWRTHTGRDQEKQRSSPGWTV